MKSKIFVKIWHDEMSSAGQWDNGQGTIDFVSGNQKSVDVFLRNLWFLLAAARVGVPARFSRSSPPARPTTLQHNDTGCTP